MGVLDRREHDKDNATGLKEEGGIEMSTTVLHYAMLALFALYLLTIVPKLCVSKTTFSRASRAP